MNRVGETLKKFLATTQLSSSWLNWMIVACIYTSMRQWKLKINYFLSFVAFNYLHSRKSLCNSVFIFPSKLAQTATCVQLLAHVEITFQAGWLGLEPEFPSLQASACPQHNCSPHCRRVRAHNIIVPLTAGECVHTT